MSAYSCGSSRQESPLFTPQGSYSSNTTPISDTPSEHRWSDVIPPKTALKFAVIWDSEDLVAFSGGELEEDDSRTEDLLLGSPSDACSQVLSVGCSTIPLSDKSSTLLYFRENMGSVLEASSPQQNRRFRGRTQTSSTLEGLDVYLRGSMFGQAHQNNRYYSCLEDLDGQFEFDPRTSFAKGYMRGGSSAEEKEIVDDMVTDEGFYEVQLAPRQRHISTERSARHGLKTTSSDSTSTGSNFVTIENDDASSVWSAIEAPESPSYSGITSRDQCPPIKRRLTKRRPADLPARPSEVLRREVFSHQVSLPPRNAKVKPPSQAPAKKPLSKLVHQLSKKKPIEGDQWICIEVSHEVRQRVM